MTTVAFKFSWAKQAFKVALFCSLAWPGLPAFSFEFTVPRLNMTRPTGVNCVRLTGTDPLEGASTDCSSFTEEEVEHLRQLGLVVCQGPSANSFRLIRGVVVCHPDANITVCTKFGDINVRKGSVVLLTIIDDCLGIHSLHQSSMTSVTWVADGVTCQLYPGKQLIITPTKIRNSDELPSAYQKLVYRHVEEIPIDKYKRGFYMDFSIPSALASVKPLKQMLFSGNRRDKAAINKVLKDNVILVGLDSSRRSYSP